MKTCNFFVDRNLFLGIFFIVNCFANFDRVSSWGFSHDGPAKSFFSRFFPINARCFMLFKERCFFRSWWIFRRAVLMACYSKCGVVCDRVSWCAAFCLCFRHMFFWFRFGATNGFYFIGGTFTCRCKFELVICMIRRYFQGITSVNWSTTNNFLFPFFQVAIAFGASKF